MFFVIVAHVQVMYVDVKLRYVFWISNLWFTEKYRLNHRSHQKDLEGLCIATILGALVDINIQACRPQMGILPTMLLIS